MIKAGVETRLEMEFTALFSFSLLFLGLVSKVITGRTIGPRRYHYDSINYDCWQFLILPDGELAVCGFPGLPDGGILQPSGRMAYSAGETVNYSCQGWGTLIIWYTSSPPPPSPLISHPSSSEHWTYKNLDWESPQFGRFEIIIEQPTSGWPGPHWEPGETMWR